MWPAGANELAAMRVYIYIYIYIYVCVCVCAAVSTAYTHERNDAGQHASANRQLQARASRYAWRHTWLDIYMLCVFS